MTSKITFSDEHWKFLFFTKGSREEENGYFTFQPERNTVIFFNQPLTPHLHIVPSAPFPRACASYHHPAKPVQ
ncbi:hypothetical protein D3C87_1947270 [compost metagenome]